MFVPSLLSPVSNLALIGDVGGLELLVILTASLMLFGGKGLPGIARSLGKISRDLQRASQEFKNQLLTADEPVLPELSYHEPEFTDQTAEIKDQSTEAGAPEVKIHDGDAEVVETDLSAAAPETAPPEETEGVPVATADENTATAKAATSEEGAKPRDLVG